MKVSAVGLVLLSSACALPRAAPVRAATAEVEGARELVDRLRDDDVYRPRPTGAGARSEWVDLPPGAYVAQGWPLRWTCRPVACRR
jgi:hypothetical protein